MISRIRTFFNNIKLRNKLTLIVIMAVAIPIVIIFSAYSSRLLQMITSDTIREEQESAAITAPLVEEFISDIINDAASIEAMPFYQRAFGHTTDEDLNDLFASDESYKFEEQISGLIPGSQINNVRFYIDLPGDDPLFASDRIFRPVEDISVTYWYGIFHSTFRSSLFCPSYYLSHYEAAELGECAYIYSTFIRTEDDTFIRCFMACYFPAEPLQKILIDNLAAESSVSYIISDRNAMVTSTDPGLAGVYFMDYNTITESLVSSNGFLERSVMGENVYVNMHTISRTDWVLVTVLPSDLLIRHRDDVVFTLIVTILIAIFLGILVSIGISRTISNRISEVSERMSSVKHSIPVPLDTPPALDEIGDLVDSYNYMARQIKNLIESRQRTAEELRTAEFDTLQSQINPHFLYNTMEMINWMAQQGKLEETSDAIHNMSRFYRLTLSKKKTIVTIREEIEHISIYVHLQNMRFDDRIELVIDIPDIILDYMIPHITLQPLIENSILHGILESETKRGTIVVTGWQEDEDILILISDDGAGIPPEKLKNLLKHRDPGSDKGAHIAVYNTHRRLQIHYGRKYGLTYSSKPGEGTDVEIRIKATLSPESVHDEDG